MRRLTRTVSIEPSNAGAGTTTGRELGMSKTLFVPLWVLGQENRFAAYNQAPKGA